ncbi:MAG TPA: N-acyl homoserine lactonase family protein [Pirellulales bacterium]|jgi:glyoxylase-like metal-dependent hydrolase (beta-lactamase superfamily II)
MKIHAIQTGSVRIKSSQRVGRGRGQMRQLHVLFDRAWTEWLPIYAWAIETSEGTILVDTGETARTALPGYFPRWHPYFWLAVQLSVTPEQEIGPQLHGLGIDPLEVRKVVLTHLHTDHAGGLEHFPRAEILVSQPEYRAAEGLAGQVRGYLPNRWPKWFQPRFIEFQKSADCAPFERSAPLTTDGAVMIVPTPGHTPGHVSVIVRDGDTSYFLAGDTTYSQDALRDHLVDGVSPDAATALRTIQTILGYAKQHPTVYLPAHDPESPARLRQVSTV